MPRQVQDRWFRGPDDDVRGRLEADLRRLGGADPFAALGVGYEVSAVEVRAAFLRATKDYHPNRFARRDREVVRLANEVFLLIKEAYGRIADDERRARELDRLGRGRAAAGAEVATAKAAAAKGKAAAPAPRAAEAAPPRTRARSPAVPRVRAPSVADIVDDGRERTARTAAELDRDRALCERGAFAEARAVFHALAVASPTEKVYRVHMHYAWGREHQEAGRPADARLELRRALDLDAAFEPAQRALEALPDDRPRPGLLSRLFKR
jgi:tetratricopeptide (TPR) repeat protein